MAYTSYSDIPAVLQGKLAKWGISTDETLRDAQILKYAKGVEGLINSKLAKLYSEYLPFSPVPDLIALISLNLTIWFLCGQQQQAGETYKENYEKALGWLIELSEGKMSLFDETAGIALVDADETGLGSNYDQNYDDDEDDYRVFPRTLLGAAPLSLPRTYRP